MKGILLFMSILFLTSCGVATKTEEVKTPEYFSHTYVYSSSDPKKQNNNIAFIVLHPKNSIGRDHDGVGRIAFSLSSEGYTAYAPNMPYQHYSATLTDAFRLLDELAERASQGNKKVFITGHSMGAAVALLYASAYKPHKNVAGIILMAPGHLLQVSGRLQDATARSVQHARKLVASGKGDEKGSFTDYNQGRKSSISTTPTIYLSYFDPKEFPNPATHMESLQVPLLWIDGEYDIGATRLGFEALFDRAAKFPQNKYMTVPTGHKDAPERSSGPILQWVKQFQ